MINIEQNDSDDTFNCITVYQEMFVYIFRIRKRLRLSFLIFAEPRVREEQIYLDETDYVRNIYDMILMSQMFSYVW